MSIRWLVSALSGTSKYVVALSVALVTFVLMTYAYWQEEASITSEFLSPLRIAGIILMFSTLPAYLFLVVGVEWTRTREVFQGLRGSLPDPLIDAVFARQERLSVLAIVLLPLGAVYGVSQNQAIAEQMWAQGDYGLLDSLIVVTNTVLWIIIVGLLTWRVPQAAAMGRAFEQVRVDVYDMAALAPLARVATLDVLLVMGAMAFQPLQSLDGGIRFGNYVPGTIVGVLAATTLFLLPMLGLRRAVRRAKAERIVELDTARRAVPLEDVAQLELIEAHRDRIRNVTDWALDVRLVTRIVAYGVLPPLAWVAAALVENFIDTL